MTGVVAIVGVAICLSATMAWAWLMALWTGRSGWIDAIWSFATGLFGAALALIPMGDDALTHRQLLVAAMALFWSLRLGIHITMRTLSGGEDPRYTQLRVEWGRGYKARLFWFLQIQALAALVLALSIMIAARNPMPGLTLGDGTGVALLAAAIMGEAVADRQLSRFRSDPLNTGKICDTGLWRYTRHPNYVFEWLVWVAYAVIAIDLTGNYPQGWLAFAGPFLMYWLLVHASGIPPLEAHMVRSRGDAFRAYQRRVNAFWPGLPKGDGASQDNGDSR
ncbi:DUF1295 domain-containing protein [Chelatococcus asaccharovorans]|uniref:DUF1295 domain-containing protein n=1 Tax=Chelatococcus asaccharovorans TaxID=28210 RepID=UPI00224C6BE4|nr:DUF1295 domain-containing protein [Chelatococcus asaccharovorans]CAH1669514.1 Steroid 5-alpha reductase family enzyme [Chelatococcus asaccharovorans]CAH1679051.1 Steroid 5-alpha reductase family enzyme [Chelatococcus asaccharovorans]